MEIKKELKSYNTAVSQFSYLCGQCGMANLKLYLFIDDYDYLSRLYLTNGRSHVGGSVHTPEEQCMAQFFAAIKGAAAGTALQRMFITGEFPVNYGGLTSGFNIGTNYSFSLCFNELMGFSEEEVRDVFDYYASGLPFRHTVDELIQVIKTWCGNYCFLERMSGKVMMYNSAMVFYFLNSYIQNGYEIPDKMLGTNIWMDYNEKRELLRHSESASQRISIIQKVFTKGFVLGKLNENFPAENINDSDNFLSNLFYLGVVTVDGAYQGATKFVIPNDMVRNHIMVVMQTVTS